MVAPPATSMSSQVSSYGVGKRAAQHLHAHHLLQGVHHLDEVTLVLHHRVDVIVGRRDLVEDDRRPSRRGRRAVNYSLLPATGGVHAGKGEEVDHPEVAGDATVNVGSVGFHNGARDRYELRSSSSSPMITSPTIVPPTGPRVRPSALSAPSFKT